MLDTHRNTNRRHFMQLSAAAALGTLASQPSAAIGRADARTVQTVLGPVAPDQLGVTLMHEHAPIVDWSELYETKPAPLGPVRDKMLAYTVRVLEAFRATLAADEGPGAIVETSPIRVGRYPDLLVELARRT